MNRAQMTERVTVILDPLMPVPEVIADQILDAILPQVTTVAELEAVQWGAVLLSAFGVPYIWHSDEKRLRVGNHRFEPGDALADGPLTVVWQPEATA